ncbi:Nitrile hydratase subunit alpha [Variovorax sp. SRS16]|uniref:nitrile hydratase subunit alpha n=1 Tax=Variovorax sp. SRS16 TaxID=282217 RepID=UPI001317A5B9|nr:nitrile hydratase subunit alpha [Variovorax sp. SRS16]VTU31088.1 Nitrile hydratase subunit alpha [Variovorax sp. SRS16]
MNHASTTKFASAEDQARALQEALQANGIMPEGYVEQWEETFDHWVPENGARIVARAWVDPAYRKLLIDDATAACRELGYGGPEGGFIVALENTPQLQNVIVCTLCSCTAWPVLGLPPDWYKSFEYRSRVVREARQVLHELGLDLPQDVQIRVWDTTAETRYMVLPMRPSGTEGWSEAKLASIVTKDCLIGVALPRVEDARG